MQVRLWGVRGSVASGDLSRIGGNTSCLEVTSGDHRLILDAGTGVRALGDQLRNTPDLTLTFLFSHLHWDHVQGFPFFAPAWRPDVAMTLFGPGADGAQVLERALTRQMEGPEFPVPLAAMRSRRTFASAEAGTTIEIGPFTIRPLDLPHPQGCIGYRIDADGKSFAYCTDVEMSLETLGPRLQAALHGIDVLTLDAQYTRAEYETSRRGWGHSTNLDAAAIARQLDVGRLLLFHHDPARDDEAVEAMAAEARTIFARAEPAREGLTLALEHR
jgi:phosphoribosyl 1,2-cyclic phosphodiesterase